MESTKINKFVNSFLSSHNSGDLTKLWNSPETQECLSETLSKKSGPKRAKSSYLFFCIDERKRISKEFPNLKAKEVTTKLGIRWRELKESNPQIVRHYDELAAKDKTRYETEKSALPVEPKIKKTKVKKKDKTGPKRGKSSYLFFCAQERPNVISEHPNMKAKEITTELGVRWQLLKEHNPSAVSQFEELAARDKSRYEAEKNGNTSTSTSIEVPTSPPRRKEKVKGFQLFCEDYRRKIDSEGKTAREVTEELTLLWKNLSKGVKSEYKSRAKNM